MVKSSMKYVQSNQSISFYLEFTSYTLLYWLAYIDKISKKNIVKSLRCRLSLSRMIKYIPSHLMCKYITDNIAHASSQIDIFQDQNVSTIFQQFDDILSSLLIAL